MWRYIRRYLPFMVLAALFMVCEVLMDLLQPTLLSRIVDDGVLGVHTGGVGDMHLIWTVGLSMIGLVLLGGFGGSMSTVFTHLACQNVGNQIRKDSFRNIMTLSFPQVDRFGTGSLVTRVTNDITQVQNLVSSFCRGLVRTTCLTFGSIYFLFRLNSRFGLIILCVFPFMVGAMALCLWKAAPLFPKLQAELDKVNAVLQEDVSGIRIIKACVREAGEKLRFGKANDAQIKTQLRTLVLFAFMNPATNALMYTAVVLMLWSGSRQVTSGFTTPGAIMAAVTYSTTLLNGINMLLMMFQNITKGTASWQRIREVLNSRPAIEDGPFDGQTDVRGKIEFQDVSFAFPGTEQEVLRHVDLTVSPGETVAIMGATGSGKTALVSLIPRFYDVTGGSVLVDGVDVREYQQHALREKIAIALQKAELFSVTIGENIRWGRPDASEEEIRAASRVAQAEDFILSAEQGFDTPVAQRGMSLSGGQKQRVSVARAVLRDAEILIFDDSTSALDLKTEANLNAALNAARPDQTKLIIAQRVASVLRADRIVVLDHGTIVDIGTHTELLDRCPAYQDIYYSQMGSGVAQVG